MTTTNIFYKTNNEIIVSEKFNLILKNIDDIEWKNGIVEDIKKEILDRKRIIKEYSFNEELHYNSKGLEVIVDNVLMIEIGDLDKSLYHKVNKYMDTPTCEGKTFQVKFIDLYNFINNNTISKCYNNQICITYDSMPIYNKTDYLRMSGFKDFRYASVNKFLQINKEQTQNKINDLCNFGRLIDLYVKNDNAFFQLKYIMDAIGEESSYNAFYVFKMISLIEMLIKKHNYWEDEDYDEFARYVLCEEINVENKVSFVKLVIQIRNKIAHCDTKSLNIKLNTYKRKYMKYYHFDYYEYSEENWIYLNLSCKLNEILANILFSKIVMTQPIS